MDPVDSLYQCYEILAGPKDDTDKHENAYKQILQSINGTYNEKMLACQFIPRFFNDFPHSSENAFSAQLSLVQDEDVTIRKHAIKNLPMICKGSSSYIPVVTDILAQLLHCEDSAEFAIVSACLMTLLKSDVKAALTGLFHQIHITDDEVIRMEAVNFINNKLKYLPPDLISKDVEEFMLQECKKLLPSITGEEFTTLMALLTNLKLSKTILGQQALVEEIKKLVELDNEFSSDSLETLIRFIQCTQCVLPFFSPYISSYPFVRYICLQVLPSIKNMPSHEIDISLEVLKLLAEISPHCTDFVDGELCLSKVCTAIMEFVPLPSGDGLDEFNFQFTHIECLLYSLMQLGKKKSRLLSNAKSVLNLDKLKAHLRNFNCVVLNCIKTIRDSLMEERKQSIRSENKLKNIALRTMSNINSLTNDLLHEPPLFRTSITLSWKSQVLSLEDDDSIGDTHVAKRRDSTGNESFKRSRKEWSNMMVS